MRKNKSLLVISEDNLITKIIKSLKTFLKIKQDKEENEINNRTAVVLTTEKIAGKVKRNISDIEAKIAQDISFINTLNEEELDSLNEYYDNRIGELENILSSKKSEYYKFISAKKV